MKSVAVALTLMALASSMGAAQAESCSFMRSLISETFGSHEDIWMCIAFKESSFNPDARNPFSGATGLFQVEPIHCGEMDGCPAAGSGCVSGLEDPQTNAHCARSVYNAQGFGAWTTYSACASGGNNPCGGGGGGGGGGCSHCSEIDNCRKFGGGNACYSKYGCSPGSC
mmetsp:Transcript_125247/g.304114  ORF Transcript_125247/g.304114 Transcript_125247/m.304114 type:complete len:169 (+) Transcript_125247:117-623(+)